MLWTAGSRCIQSQWDWPATWQNGNKGKTNTGQLEYLLSLNWVSAFDILKNRAELVHTPGYCFCHAADQRRVFNASSSSRMHSLGTPSDCVHQNQVWHVWHFPRFFLWNLLALHNNFQLTFFLCLKPKVDQLFIQKIQKPFLAIYKYKIYESQQFYWPYVSHHHYANMSVQ